MTEKQRWLLNDLNVWQEKQFEKVGRYGPPKEPKEPAHVRAARRASAAAAKVIAQWERDRKLPWTRERNAISAKYQFAKRAILFEKTEAALKVISALK